MEGERRERSSSNCVKNGCKLCPPSLTLIYRTIPAKKVAKEKKEKREKSRRRRRRKNAGTRLPRPAATATPTPTTVTATATATATREGGRGFCGLIFSANSRGRLYHQ